MNFWERDEYEGWFWMGMFIALVAGLLIFITVMEPLIGGAIILGILALIGWGYAYAEFRLWLRRRRR